MKTRLLYEEAGLRTFALVMDKGDEAAARITAFAREQGISGAGLTAIGACRQATLGYFDPKIMDYRSTHFDGQMEVLAAGIKALIEVLLLVRHMEHEHVVAGDEGQGRAQASARQPGSSLSNHSSTVLRQRSEDSLSATSAQASFAMSGSMNRLSR
ncbi:PPC domain-containing DNA-binding protein [Streptomyces ochraceiscleroticus]|uniref:PPC domain-containing DNA-binding protein n=1 Tax=Streptomyces ochraceiscleroticus TaxID=47761 RepID=UPI00068D7851|nr:DUF296 domain-containing protein [Streptomyces ochraceiscleroticus]